MDANRTFAERFVEILLRRFGSERTFEVDVLDDRQRREVEEAFHRAGCATTRFENLYRLSVTVSPECREAFESHDLWAEARRTA